MSNSWPDSAVMMTLSGLANSSDISGQLQNTNYATQGDWSVVWGPYNDSYGNLAYVTKSASTGNYALAIRGSETNISFNALYNWFFDFYVTWQSPWPYLIDAPQARISRGAWDQASNLTIATWNGQTLGNFLTQSIPASATVYVTGHSLGGNLASVLASWISFQRGPSGSTPDPNTVVYTFAAPSAGNTGFADGFNLRLPNSYRYWNSLDAIPRAWDHLLQLNSIYEGIGISTPGWVQDTVDGLDALLLTSELEYGSFYLQPNGGGTELSGSAAPAVTDYLNEVIYQHNVNVYLGLLGAPLIVPIAQPNLALATATRASLKGDFLPRPIIERQKAIEKAQLQTITGLADLPHLLPAGAISPRAFNQSGY
jgi:triacylglycerol lipase